MSEKVVEENSFILMFSFKNTVDSRRNNEKCYQLQTVNIL